MSIEQETTDVTATNDDNLDLFSADFFGEKQPTSGNAKPEDDQAEDNAEDGAQNDEQDTQPNAEEDGATEESDKDDEENPDTTEEDKPKKKDRLQERINELTAARRQAERERDEALAKLNEKQPEPKPTQKAQETAETESPKPTDKNEDGTDKYPLGEFDPKFVKDTIQHALAEQAKQMGQKRAEEAKLTEQEKYRATLEASWNEKLEDVQERYPDYREKGEAMLSVFEGIDPGYGQYLTDTLMEMDAGPEVFYYLANNLDEAEEIVNAGPRKATIALAKLEVQLAGNKTTKTAATKVTKAPTPPPQVKGSAVAKPSVSADTDDLNAFEKAFFKKK